MFYFFPENIIIAYIGKTELKAYIENIKETIYSDYI